MVSATAIGEGDGFACSPAPGEGLAGVFNGLEGGKAQAMRGKRGGHLGFELIRAHVWQGLRLVALADLAGDQTVFGQSEIFAG